MTSRRLFAAGCWVVIACGLVHLLGHYTLVTATGQTDADRQMLALMRGNARDMGLGFVRSTFDLLKGFSLAFSVECLGFGALGLVAMRRVPGFPPLLRSVAGALAVALGALSVVGFVYWFPAPLSFLVLSFLCFAAAWAMAPPVSGAGS
jgi:hypothetical protein